jgi:hypothetical protein
MDEAIRQAIHALQRATLNQLDHDAEHTRREVEAARRERAAQSHAAMVAACHERGEEPEEPGPEQGDGTMDLEVPFPFVDVPAADETTDEHEQE